MANIHSINIRDFDADAAEARRCLKVISEQRAAHGESVDNFLNDWERSFVSSVAGQLDERGWISERQLFALRGLKDKLLEYGTADSRAARHKRAGCGRNRFFDLEKAERAARAINRVVQPCAACTEDQAEDVWHVV